METADFDFSLPPERIAAAPRRRARRCPPVGHGSARRAAQARAISAICWRACRPRSLLVLNDTRVFPARLRGRKPTGGAVEFLLTRRVSIRATRRRAERRSMRDLGGARRVGSAVRRQRAGRSPSAAACEVEVRRAPRRGTRAAARSTGPGPSLLRVLDEIGEVPLPPYIEAARRRLGSAAPAVDDRERYQTVYARAPGAVAAPTAGLHFTPALLDALRARRARDRVASRCTSGRARSRRSRRRSARRTGCTPSATGFPSRRARGDRARAGARAAAWSRSARPWCARSRRGARARRRGRGGRRARPSSSSCRATASRWSPTWSPTSTCRARRCSCWWRVRRARARCSPRTARRSSAATASTATATRC